MKVLFLRSSHRCRLEQLWRCEAGRKMIIKFIAMLFLWSVLPAVVMCAERDNIRATSQLRYISFSAVPTSPVAERLLSFREGGSITSE